jgi:hypothetical protein
MLASLIFSFIFILIFYLYFKNFIFFITYVYPIIIYFGGYITIGATSIHIAELLIPLFLLRKPFIKEKYTKLDIIFLLFFILSSISLIINSPFDFLFYKTIFRFFEIIVLYFIYSKYSKKISFENIQKIFNKIVLIIIIISFINYVYIIRYDTFSWMKNLILLGFIPKGVETLGYLESWSSNNTVQANFLIEHQYTFMFVSAFYLSFLRLSYFSIGSVLFFIFFATNSSTIQISFLLSLIYFCSRSTHLKYLVNILIIFSLIFFVNKYSDELSFIFDQIRILIETGQLMEINSGMIRLSYLLDGISHPSFNLITGIGLDIFRYQINPHEIVSYLYFIYGLHASIIFLYIFYYIFTKKRTNLYLNRISKSFFLFAFISSFGVNYFTSIVTFFPFILFLFYHNYINEKNSSTGQ